MLFFAYFERVVAFQKLSHEVLVFDLGHACFILGTVSSRYLFLKVNTMQLSISRYVLSSSPFDKPNQPQIFVIHLVVLGKRILCARVLRMER